MGAGLRAGATAELARSRGFAIEVPAPLAAVPLPGPAPQQALSTHDSLPSTSTSQAAPLDRKGNKPREVKCLPQTARRVSWDSNWLQQPEPRPPVSVVLEGRSDQDANAGSQMWGPCGDPLPLPSPLPGSSGRAGGSGPSSPPSLARELRVYGCHNKVPRTGRLTTAEVCSLGVPKSRKPESRCRHGQRPLQGLGEPRPRPSPTFQWSPAMLGLQLQRADLCPAPTLCPLCAGVPAPEYPPSH